MPPACTPSPSTSPLPSSSSASRSSSRGCRRRSEAGSSWLTAAPIHPLRGYPRSAPPGLGSAPSGAPQLMAAAAIMRYEVSADGSLSNGRVFFDMTAAPGEDALDRMKVDQQGNRYVSGPGGLWIL